MIEIGKINQLSIKEKVIYGYLLDGGEFDDILLINKQAREGLAVGDVVSVA